MANSKNPSPRRKGRPTSWPWEYRQVTLNLPADLERAVRAEAAASGRHIGFVMLELMAAGMADRLPAGQADAYLSFARKET